MAHAEARRARRTAGDLAETLRDGGAENSRREEGCPLDEVVKRRTLLDWNAHTEALRHRGQPESGGLPVGREGR